MISVYFHAGIILEHFSADEMARARVEKEMELCTVFGSFCFPGMIIRNYSSD